MNKKRRSKQSSFIYNPWWTYGTLVALAILLYLNTLGHGYTLDDAIVITENMFTTAGIEGIPGLFSHDTFYGFFQEEGKAQLVSGGRYRPLSLLFFALLWEVFGHAPWTGHLLNILVYAGLGCLLYGTLHIWFKKIWNDQFARWTAWMTALFFIAHPVHTEVVANIKGLDEQLSLAGGLGALFLIRKYMDRKHSTFTLPLAIGCLLLGILSKENALMLVGLIPVSIAFFERKKIWPQRGTRVLLWMAGGVALYAFIRFYLVGLSFGGEAPMELMNNPFVKVENGQYLRFETGEWLATTMVGLWTYLRLLFLPHPLTHDYYPRHFEVYDFSMVLPWMGLLLHVGLLYLAIRGWSQRKWYSYAIAWYLITLFIYTNIPVNLGTHLSERFLFTPGVGFALLLGVLSVKWRNRFKRQSGVLSWILPAVIILIMGIKTIDRNAVWKSNFTLFTTDVKTSERSAKLRNAVGGEYSSMAGEADDEKEKKKWARKALPHLQTALNIHPRYKNAWLLRGNTNYYLDRYDRAISHYKKALQIDPNYGEAQRNLRFAYRDGGRYYGEKVGDIQKSIRYLREAYRRNARDYETLRLLGVAYGMSDQSDRAIKFFQKAVDQKPKNANALYNLGSAYYNAGKPDSGKIYRRRALRIDPDAGNRNRPNQ